MSVIPTWAETGENFERGQRAIWIRSPSLHQRDALEPARVITSESLQKAPTALQRVEGTEAWRPEKSTREKTPRDLSPRSDVTRLSNRMRFAPSGKSKPVPSSGTSFVPLGGSLHVGVHHPRKTQSGSCNVPMGTFTLAPSQEVATRQAEVEEPTRVQFQREEQAQMERSATRSLISSVQQNIDRWAKDPVSRTPPATNGTPFAPISEVREYVVAEPTKAWASEATVLNRGDSQSQLGNHRIHELELEVEKLSRSFQEINLSLKRQAREIAIETFSNQIAGVRQQVMEDAQMVVKQQANEFLYETLSKPTSSARLHQAIVSSPQLSQHIQRVVEERIQQVVNTCVRAEVKQLGHEVFGDLRQIAEEINAECQLRARGDNDLNASLRFEVASVRAHVEATRIHLEEADAKARQTNIEELAELRNILESVWSKATRVKDTADPNYYFKFVDPKGGGDETASYKECIGDSEDINTLYEMVREALGTNIMMRKDLDEEKSRRELEKVKVERLEQDTLQLERRYQMLQGTIRDLHPQVSR